MVEMIGIYISVPLYVIGTLLLGASITAGMFVFHVAIVPLVFKFSKTFRRSIIFGNFVQWPLRIDFEEPSQHGVEGARNFNLEFQSKVDRCHIKLGVWHILPKSAYERLKGSFEQNVDKDELNRLLDDDLATSKTPIVLYCHGNSNSRAAPHRILLYKFLQQLDCHTIAFDYRGYGDSTNITPREAGVVEDALVVYDWLLSTARKKPEENIPPIFVWGHSLGTGIASHLLGNIKELSTLLLDRSDPLPLSNGLVLEAPFNNIADEVEQFPLSKLVTWLPYYDVMFKSPFRTHPEQRFCSDTHLTGTKKLPLLILHARDDVVVPFRVGLKLYKSIQESRAAGGAPCKLHEFDKHENLGHKYICKSTHLPAVVREFFSDNK